MRELEYTVRFAHLESVPLYAMGSVLRRGDIVGIMGNTGKSTANHLHIDCVGGVIPSVFRQEQIDRGRFISKPRQLLYFLDQELFGVPLIVTTNYACPEYFKNHQIVHHGFDVVPIDRFESKDHYSIHWNRSMVGIVIGKGYDDGYGNYINIAF